MAGLPCSKCGKWSGRFGSWDHGHTLICETCFKKEKENDKIKQ